MYGDKIEAVQCQETKKWTNKKTDFHENLPHTYACMYLLYVKI